VIGTGYRPAAATTSSSAVEPRTRNSAAGRRALLGWTMGWTLGLGSSSHGFFCGPTSAFENVGFTNGR